MDAGYHVFDYLPVAKRIVQVYQQHLPYHSRGIAVQEVTARLAEGATEQDLMTAAVTYAKWVRDVARKELRYACSASVFYGQAGEWERFKDGTLPAIPADPVQPDKRDPGAAAAAVRAAERQRNTEQIKGAQLPPMSREELRRFVDRLRGGIGEMPAGGG